MEYNWNTIGIQLKYKKKGKMFDILIHENRQFLRGPSIYSYRKSVLSVVVDIGILEQYPSSSFPDFDKKLLSFLPGLESHRCNGGFINRVRKGTYVGHILEHVALELQSVVTKCDSGFGRTKEIKPSIYRVTIMTFDEKMGNQCIEEAKDLVLSIVHGNEKSFNFDKALERIHDSMELTKASIHLLDKAYDLYLPFIILYKNLIQFNYGNKQKRLWKGYGHATSHLSDEISMDKVQTKNLISPFIRVPPGMLCSTKEEAIHFFKTLQKEKKDKKVVLKPVKGNNAQSVFTNVESETEIHRIFGILKEKGFTQVLVEEMLQGTRYRVLVVHDKIVGVLESIDEYIIGDGHSTIQELINSQLNEKIIGYSDVHIDLNPSSSHPQYLFSLQKLKKNPESILAQKIKLLIRSNTKYGKDVSTLLHPQTRLQIMTAVQMIGLDIAGVDVVAKDISIPLDEQDGGVCEINSKPSWSDHIDFPNKNISLVQELVDYHFPDFSSSTSVLPILSFVGNIIPSFMIQGFHCIGWATENDVFLQYSNTLDTLDTLDSIVSLSKQASSTYYEEAQKILIHPEVELAILQTNFEDVEKNGLPYLQSKILILDEIDKKSRYYSNQLLQVVLDALSKTFGMLLIRKGLEKEIQLLFNDFPKVYVYKDHDEMWKRVEKFLTK